MSRLLTSHPNEHQILLREMVAVFAAKSSSPRFRGGGGQDENHSVEDRTSSQNAKIQERASSTDGLAIDVQIDIHRLLKS